MIVIGAGMAGLLAAGMLRNDCEGVLEAQSSLPNNHSAVLRFRSSIVGDTLNIPFRQVKVMKAVHSWTNPVADVIAYSRKTNGTASLRSIIAAGGEIEERFIAPPDLIEQMAARLKCPPAFDQKFSESDINHNVPTEFISTLPMPVLMDILKYGGERPQFRYVEGLNINARLHNTDVFATLYVPDPEVPFNRLSITGDNLTIEIAFPGLDDEDVTKVYEKQYSKGRTGIRDVVLQALNMLGIPASALRGVPEASRQRYAKILPVSDRTRKDFIMWASETRGVYSLGRFATWRPGLLLDDLVNDVRVIQRIRKSGSYDHKRG